jgi:hypothetical protein
MRQISNMAASFGKAPHLASAAITVALGALALSACNGPASSFLAPSGAQGSHAARHFTASPTPSPSYTYTTVDDPNSNVNQVTTINQLSKIAGVYEGGSASNIPQSYSSEPIYTKFKNMNEPNTQGTFVTSISSNRYVAGYVLDPNGESGIWGFVRVRGLWTLFQDDNQATEILGINDSENAVGFYVNSSGIDVPFELNVPQNTYITLDPPGATGNAEATGITGKGEIAGWEQTSGSVISWYLQGGTYYQFSYSGFNTYALSVNWSDQVVGYYTDSAGLSHGFILTGPTKGGAEQVWQTIDEPNAVYGTVVTGINNHHDICGYYIDASGVQHGFIAVPQAS